MYYYQLPLVRNIAIARNPSFAGSVNINYRSISSAIVAVVYLSQFQPYMLRVHLHQRRDVISNGKERIYDVGVGFGDGEC